MRHETAHRQPALPLLFALLLLAAHSACGDDEPSGPGETDPVPSVVEAASEPLPSGTVGEALADAPAVVVRDSEGDGVAGVMVGFSVSAGSLSADRAQTDDDGRASVEWTLGETAGEQTATAEVDGLDPVEFTATAAPGPVAVVAADVDTLRFVALDETRQLEATVADEYGNAIDDVEASWLSSDTSVVVIDASGLAGARASGEAELVVEAGQAADTVPVDVSQVAESILVTPAADTLVALGDARTLEVRVEDANGHEVETTNIDWTSGDDDVAAVDDAGDVSAVGNGEADIVASLGALADTARVRVRQELTLVAVTPAADTLVVGDTLELAVSALDPNDEPIQWPYDVAWSSSDGEIAAVDVDGEIAGVGVGHVEAVAEIEPTDGGAESGNGSAALLVSPHPARSVAIGQGTVCVLDIEGRAYCWGENTFGQVGDGSTEPRFSATAVAGDHVFEAIAVGVRHACGLTSPGRMFCWGSNQWGRLGTGGGGSTAEPQQVIGDHRFVSMDLSFSHTCALTNAGAAYCWGRDFEGQLADGSPGDTESEPVPVTGDLTFASVATGQTHTCGLTPDGEVYCWGRNRSGQFGDGTTSTETSPPVAAAGGQTFAAITTSSNHSCGVTDTGDAYCWGSNIHGAVGDGSTQSIRPSPQPVAGGLTFERVDAGRGFTCGMTAGRDAYCWGDNFDGSVGDGSFRDRHEPVPVVDASDVAYIVAGASNACGLASGGSLYCWGGAYGVMLDPLVSAPVPISGVMTGGMAATYDHRCAIGDAGAAYCWGLNADGQLGDGTTNHSAVPAPVSGGLTFEAVAPGGFHSCGVATDGGVHCWGANEQGQLGQGAGTTGGSSTTPVEIAGGRTYRTVASGIRHSCALTDAGQAYCWGFNDRGQLGGGSNATIVAEPIQASDTVFTALTLGRDHSCGTTDDGRAYCWGSDLGGQLGGTAPDDCSGQECARTAIPVDGGLTFDTLIARGRHTCGIATDGDAYCWGRNSSGELGVGDDANRASPAAVASAVEFDRLGSGTHHACGIAADGAAYCWGRNHDGRLGTGTTEINRKTPTAVAGGHAFASIHGTNDHTCGVTTSGEVYCWGFNGYGEFGGGETAYVPRPTPLAAGLRLATGSDPD
ncbi:MAG: hypothetical protein ACODAE_07045 [Gemmatimonadota bacterium]